MKALKLFIIFLVLVGGVFLAISLGFIFGNTSGEDDVDEYAKKEAVDQAAMEQAAMEQAAKEETAKEETAKMEAAAQAAKEKAVMEKAVMEKAVMEKADLIQFINKKPTLGEYRMHSGYKLLNQDERIAIETFLNAVHNPRVYKLNGKGTHKLKDLAQEKYAFKTMDDIKEVQKEIINIMNEETNKKKK